MTSLSPDTRATTSSDRSQASSIKSIELLPSNLSPSLKPQNGQVTPPEAQLKQPEKTSVKNRITRMFSQRSPASHDGVVTPTNGNAPTKKQPPVQPTTLSQQQAPLSQSSQSPQLKAQQQALQQALAAKEGHVPASANALVSAPPSSTATSGPASPVPRSQAPSRKGSGTEKPLEKAAPAPPATPSKPAKNTSNAVPFQRFIADPNLQGGHEHHLKSSRRQEKLMDMFRGLILGKKPDHPESDLSLVSSWVDNLKQEKDSLVADKKVTLDKKLAASAAMPASTLIEKYGKCQEIVGRGAFGVVRISHKKLADGMGEKLYAVKEFRRRTEENEKKYSKRLTAEFCISSSLRHPNVIHTLDLLKDAKGDYCEVMEFCAGGDLYTLVLTAGKLEVQEADCFFKQMMRGVEYMHEMGVAHRDLKPENLLLTTHGGLKITDFGNGECFRMAWESDAHMVSGLCGSAPYIAPEEYVNKEFDARAVDVWACGVIYMAMRTGRHLWRVAKKDEDEFYGRYLDGRRDEEGYGPIESLHRARCRNVIYSILDPNPSRRITASQVLKSEWGREIKLCKAGEEGL
ncbi:serine/threonine-protein kinase hal4 [Niveomyces insectorum RCEF 264]|uniref:non-specific serine/threonine protein kinase n=1 Tax=Niveomyces insectorum RCEF 264 TaxID=1081102 RepID=A0A167PHA8_9HYPO|nr:serine/threonine-protein kinase hal4 [Niveomyces insectorum RCEF 264]